MKKIGIMTYHRAMNFGAKLQAFALQSILADEYNTYIIDYRCKKIESFFYPPKSLKTIIKNLARMVLQPSYSRDLRNRYVEFYDFDKRFHLTECYTEENIAAAKEHFDLFIAGSDQIWNLDISGNDFNYFLPFADDCQKYTYAASFGGTIEEEDVLWKKTELFTGFQSLIIREQSGVNFLKKILPNKHCNRALDPVFLLDKEIWIQSFDLKETKHYQSYVLVYFVSKIQQTYALEYAKRIAKENNLNIIYINAGKPLDHEIQYKNDVGPISFLSLIFNAYAVITTSFHAEAFSILFNVPFMYELTKTSKNTNARLSELAILFDLDKQEILSADTAFNFNIDWNKVNERLRLLRDRSRDLLMKSLSFPSD